MLTLRAVSSLSMYLGRTKCQFEILNFNEFPFLFKTTSRMNINFTQKSHVAVAD